MKIKCLTNQASRAPMLACLIFFVVRGPWFEARANEALESREISMPRIPTEIVVREQSTAGKAFVVIRGVNQPPRKDLENLFGNKYSRPDYRMLQKGVSAKDVGYDGPYSSKKKIYILAATLATAGATAAVVGPALFPAAATTGAAGSAAVPAVAAAAGGSAVAIAAKKYQDHFQNLPDDYNRETESKIIETETDFYQIYISKVKRKPF